MRILLVALVGAMLAGCVGADNETDDAAIDELLDLPVLSEPILIDDVRAGGEPVIAITHEGTILVAAHPGWTHYHPSEDPAHPGAEILEPVNAESYLWRSTDGGESWTHVGLPTQEAGPRSTALGVSDPEFTVMEDGTVCYTDLLALATSSVACSTDDGLTWLPGNNVASGGVNDRQWLASVGNELYFTANYFVDHHIRASTDRGLTWEDRGDVPCAQDLVGNPLTGHLVVGCDAGVAVSEDGGRTWSDVRSVPNASSGGQRIMAEPGIDSAGNTWITWTKGEHGLFAAGSPDEGLTWPWTFDLSAAFDAQQGTPGTYVWPWLSAGSDGRFAVSWIGTQDAVDSASHDGDWFVYTAFVLDATGAGDVQVLQWTPEPIHHGPVCQDGTTCQVASMQGDDGGDRRLGDFFETTIDAEGFLHGTWSNTLRQADDVISHPEYARQTGGPRLIAEDEIGAWFPTQG